MSSNGSSKLQQFFETASLFGKSVAISQVQKMLMPHILEVFTEHNHEELRRYIITDYPLVRKHTPEGVKNALANLGSNPEMRRQWESMALELVTPENIIGWMREPEAWLDEAEADRQRAELKRCADVIEQTEGGREWLDEQVLQVYRFARIVPEEDKRVEADD